jgi:hypothetical protein
MVPRLGATNEESWTKRKVSAMVCFETVRVLHEHRLYIITT